MSMYEYESVVMLVHPIQLKKQLSDQRLLETLAKQKNVEMILHDLNQTNDMKINKSCLINWINK